ncbi:MAG: PorP/SprF family type IX secretion system membrane protein [Paludibacteraceae bacterium]|nr:PorP/SprF family type IX secretion system membrane protein [Paludibacteraceae bacterium]MBP6283818.1 PorP/SprF family type IX secretion system membrane protein [Paludibacteraceae bacterium]
MKKKLLVWLFIVSATTIGFAQQNVQFSQFTLNINAINPAVTGNSEMIQISGVHRQQWLNLQRAPQTTFMNVELPFLIQHSKHGVGISFLNESIGLFTDQSIWLKYAYHKEISNNTNLSGGLVFQFKSLGFNAKDADLGTSDYHAASDPSVPSGTDISDLKTDIGIGALLTNKAYTLGISLQNIVAPTYQLSNAEFNSSRQLNLFGIYNIRVINSLYLIKPSVLTKTDFASWQFEVATIVEYKEKYWGGLGYRLQDALIFQVGTQLASGLTIGYAFDLPVSKMLYTSIGTHELSLSYSFKLDFAKKQTYKSIRYL